MRLKAACQRWPDTPECAYITLSGQEFTVTGVVDIQGGGQFVASNFYLDIDEARALGGLPADAVNQVFLKVANIDQTEAIKERIAGWLPKASIVSSGSMLQLFGGISQVIGRFHIIALLGGGLAAAALIATLLFGAMAERRKEAAILRTLGWSRMQTRRQLVPLSTWAVYVSGLLEANGAERLRSLSLNTSMMGWMPRPAASQCARMAEV